MKLSRLQLEITNYCNAKCRYCEREINTDINSTYLPLSLIKKKFPKEKFPKLSKITLCGNTDEPTTHPEVIDIIKFFKDEYPNASFSIATNGGSRDTKFWRELGKLKCKVTFGIDGLEDTNHIYRVNVKWNRLKDNWRAYIKAGGLAQWQFIPFEWNKHQQTDCMMLAFKEGFKLFEVQENDRV
jgi:MoaA/NifB/PqqE/SkfB family radical SAM enzyme